MIDGDPWFVAKDVCDVLEHTNTAVALLALEDFEKGIREVYTPGGKQSMTIINESGMYALVLRSRKPQAKPFRLWVTNEVLPAPTTLADAPILGEHRLKRIEEAVRLASLWTEQWNAPLDDTIDNNLDMHEGGNRNNGTI